MSELSAPMPPSGGLTRYGVLVPAKPPAVAKSRLAALGDEVRFELAFAFVGDTVAAALDCAVVDRVLVVTDDHELARAMSDLGADVLPDGTTVDLNVTLQLAAAELHRRDPGLALAALCADLPALDPAELAEALGDADSNRMSFVADHDGDGTTAVVAPDPATFRPAFGVDSRSSHLAAGAYEIRSPVPTLRRDVDRPDQLSNALRLGVGVRTTIVAQRRGLVPRT
jgi:2-phospho-L-lactate/phosphoenolpyruvate guanylyltransferase